MNFIFVTENAKTAFKHWQRCINWSKTANVKRRLQQWRITQPECHTTLVNLEVVNRQSNAGIEGEPEWWPPDLRKKAPIPAMIYHFTCWVTLVTTTEAASWVQYQLIRKYRCNKLVCHLLLTREPLLGGGLVRASSKRSGPSATKAPTAAKQQDIVF